MPAFKEMPEAEVLKIISQYEDVLTAESKKQEVFLRQFKKCARCGSKHLTQEIPAAGAFRNGALIALPLLKCAECGWTFDPDSGLVTNVGPLVPPTNQDA
jgi:DNA-directed RNA polymerase subunit RPC12/RpoP